MDKNNQIILYEGSPLERIAASDIVLRSDTSLMKQKRLYLASDVFVGEYNVTGFVVVDNQPEQRWISYTDGDKIGVPWGNDPNQIEFDLFGITNDAQRLAHFIGTDKGFKMIRYFILPLNVEDFFRSDRYIGEPLIDKCVCEGTIPDEFDEQKVNPVYAFREREEEELIDRIIEHINPRLKQIGESRLSWEHFGHHVYFSFHPWQVYKPILEVGEESIVRAIRNFDKLLSRFDEKKKLQKRILKVKGAEEYKVVLPPLE
jgi:hypothetical protein